MQTMLGGGLISVNVSWIPATEADIKLDVISQCAIESHIKNGKSEGTILQGGYTINWKKLS